MANNNADIYLLADLDIDSSEADIIKAINILSKRLKANSAAKIKVDAEIDLDKIQKVITKLANILKTKELSVDTKNSIVNLQKEAEAMMSVVTSANKAAKEKLEFTKANKKVAESAETTASAVNNERDAMQSLGDVDTILANINMLGNNGNSVFQQFGDTLRNAFYTYTAANILENAIYKVIDAGKEGVETVKELNDAATSLRMATGDSYESVKRLMTEYNALGQELGAITTDVSDSADQWHRQGRTAEETSVLVRDSMMLSKIAQMDSADSTKYLTSIMMGYKTSVEDVADIVSKLSAVDLNSATDASGLAEAMSRTSESAQLAGISLDRLLGMVATVGEVTQKSMSSIGESYKTIFSRMRDIKDGKLSVVGDDGEVEDLSNVEIVLGKLGIQLRSSNKEFRNFQDVLDEVAAAWGNYSSVQQAAIAKSFSGVRQAENFLVLMENYNKVLDYTSIAENSQGVAEEKFGYYLESLEAKTNLLNASLENLAAVTISDELYAGVLDTTKAMVDATAESGILKGALAGLVTSASLYTMNQLVIYLRSATHEFNNFGEAMNLTRNGAAATINMQRLIDLTGGLTQSQTRLLLSTNNLTDAQKIAVLMNQGLSRAESEQFLRVNALANATASYGAVLRGVWSTLMANPLVLVTAAVTAATMAWNKYKQSIEDTRNSAVKLTTTYQEQVKSLEEQIATYKDLKTQLDKGNLSADESRSIKEQLLEIQNSLNDSYGNEVSNLNLVNGAYKEQLGLLSELSKEKATDYVNANYKAYKDAKKALEKEETYNLGSLFSYDNTGMTEAQKQLREYIKSYSDIFQLNSAYDTSTFVNSDYVQNLSIKGNAYDVEKTINQFVSDLEKYAETNGIEINLDSIKVGVSDTITEIEADEVLADYKSIYDEFVKAEIVRNDTLRPLYQQSIKAVKDYNSALSSGEGVDSARENLDLVKATVSGMVDMVEGSANVFDDIYGGINKTAEAAYNLDMAFAKDENVKGYAKQLRGLTDTDIKAINLNDIVNDPYENAFSGLLDALDLTEEETQKVIDKLMELGYITSEVQGSISGETTNKLWQFDKMDDIPRKLADIESAYKTVSDALDEYNEKGYNSMSTIDSIIGLENEYINVLLDSNGQIQISQESLNRLAEIKLEAAKASLYQEACEELTRLKTLDTALAANELFLANGTLTQSAYETAKALYEEVSAMGGANAALAGKVWDATTAKVALLDKQIASLKTGAYNVSKAVKDTAKAITDLLDAELKSLDTNMEAGYIDFKTYISNRKALIDDYYNSGKLKAADYYSYLKSHYETELSYMDKISNAVQRRLDKEIDSYEKQKESIEENYNSQIESLQKQIDLLQEQNDELDRQKQLEEALYNQRRSEEQRVNALYVEGRGKIYTADDESIREASGAVQEAETDIATSKIESQIKKLEEACKRETDSLDAVINKLQNYKEQWNDISSAYSDSQEDLLAVQMWGADWESQIINSRLDVLNSFKDSYIDIQKTIAQYAWWATEQQKLAAIEAQKGVDANVPDSIDEPKVEIKKQGHDYISTDYSPKKTSGGGLNKVAYYKDGLEQGAIKKRESDDYEIILDHALKPDETPIIAHEGEMVVNQEQAHNLASHLDNNEIPIIERGDDILPYASPEFREFQLNMFSRLSPAIPLKDYGYHNSTMPNTNNTTQHITQNITVTLPNITNETGFNNFKKELEHMRLDAYQYANKKGLW